MVNLEQKMRDTFGDKFINMVLEWEQLTKQDVDELYKLGITQVFAVYDSWEDVAKTRLTQVEEEYVKNHIVPFVDIKTFTNHIKELEKNDWLELKSGKLLVID